MAKTQLFRDAKAPSKDELKKGTTWTVPTDEHDVIEAIAKVNFLAAQVKTITTNLDAAKTSVKLYCEGKWVRHWASFREQPAAPIKLATEEGESVLFVIQDKSEGYAPGEKSIGELAAVLGTEEVEAALETVTEYTFDPTILALEAKDPLTNRKSTIAQMIQRRLGPLLDELVGSGQIERPQAESLLTASTSRVFKGSFVESLPTLCDRDPLRLGQAVAGLGSALVRFVKSA